MKLIVDAMEMSPGAADDADRRIARLTEQLFSTSAEVVLLMLNL